MWGILPSSRELRDDGDARFRASNVCGSPRRLTWPGEIGWVVEEGLRRVAVHATTSLGDGPGVLGRKEVACGMDPDYVRNLVSPLTQVASIYSVRRRGRLSTLTAGAGTGASSIRRGDR